jgi:hypothetical protein
MPCGAPLAPDFIVPILMNSQIGFQQLRDIVRTTHLRRKGTKKFFRWAYGLEDPSCGMPLDSALKSAGAEAWIVTFR